MSNTIRISFGIFFLFLLIFTAYLPSLNGGFFWDDSLWILHNPMFQNWRGLIHTWSNLFAFEAYYPLTVSSFWIEYQFWKLDPFGYHLTNIMFHMANSILLWMLLSKLRVPGAFFAAVVFAVHPVQVETVVWVTERKNLLSFLFYVLALLSYFRFFGLEERRARDSKEWVFYAGSLAFLLLSAFAKSTAFSFPIVVLLLIGWKRERVTLRDAVSLIPHGLIGLAIGWVTFFLERGYYVKAVGAEFPWSFSERIVLAAHGMMFYVKQLVWPQNLMLIYPRWEVYFLNAWPLVLLCVIAIMLLIVRRSLSKSVFKSIITGTAIFLVNVAPVLGFVNVGYFRYSFVANWWLYFASVGLFALFAAAWERSCSGLFSRMKSPLSKFVRNFFKIGIALGIVIGLWQVTSMRVPTYHDEEAIWRDTVRENPESAPAHLRLGINLQMRGKAEEALHEYRKVLQLNPDYALAHNNIGIILMGRRQFSEALFHVMEALRIQPESSDAYNNLGLILIAQGKLEGAQRCFREALRLKPDNVESFYNLKLLERRRQSLVQMDPKYFPGRTLISKADVSRRI